MKIRPCLTACSTDIAASSPPKTTAPNLHSESSSDSTTSPLSLFSQATSYSDNSLQSNLSLQTLPSIPSLQNNLSPENLNLSVSRLSLSSLKLSPFGPINFLSLHRNRLYAAAGDVVHVIDAENYTLLDTFAVRDPSSGSVKSVTFFNDKIFTAHQDCKIRVWKLVKNANYKHKHVLTLPTIEDRLRRLILPSNYVRVRRHRKRLWIEHNDAVSGLALTKAANGSGDDYTQLLCSVSWDKCLKVWKTSDSKCSESILAHDDAINAVVVAPDGTIYTGSADRRIKVWGKPFGEKKHGLIATLEKHKSAVNALALSSDGSVLFSGSCDRSILVWEKEDSANHMAVTGALRGHAKAILCLINVSDLLFSGSSDRTVRIWQRGIAGKFCCLTVLDGHEKPVRSLVADAGSGTGSGPGDKIKVFSGSFDGEIKVWEVVISKLNSPI